MRVALPAVLETSEHRYEIERELGSGGMATVHLARDVPTGTRVAVKLLRADLVAAVGLERFAREIRITSRLDHPNLLPVLDSGQVDGVPFYVTPYIAGESLSQRLKREGQLPIADTIGIACQIADALEVAHAHGFIHRDIKPGNILLAGDRAILADFGLARAVDVITGERLTESGIVLGTPAYMSPEQANNGRIDARADIYSLGCVIYEMLAGAPPFSGPTSQSLLARHAVDPVPSLRTVRGTVSDALERVVTTALAKVPADRYASARELREALQGQERTGGVSTSRSRRAVRARGLVAVGALLLLLLPLTWLYSRRGGPPAVDRNRIMVFPLIAPRGGKEPSRIGEDLATMIGSALDGAGPLRWIDAWPLLGPTLRDDIRTMTLDRARGLARSKRCGYSLSGRVVLRGDSADVFLELNDIQGDSTVARGRAAGSATDAWQVGLRAVNDVLPKLIPGTPPNLLAEWKARDPAAIASFLLGEAAFRRAHLADALGHYREAVRADSSFGLAAIRGAQAATWNHRSSEAAAFIRVASAQRLSPRYGSFARGYAAYLGGWADSAAREFHRALEIDPEMAVAWAQLGEVYTHLLPLRGNLDSLADAGFGRARQLDSTATNWLLHPIEIRLRRGDTAAATPLIHAFLTAEPDTLLAQQVRVMDACVRRGPAAVDWARMAATRPLALLAAGNELKGTAAGAPCALRAFDAVIANGAKGNEPRRWFALLGVVNILLAQGRTGDAAALIDSAIARGQGGTSLYLLAAPLEPKFAARARDIARRDELEFGRYYARCPYPMRLYELGVWEAHTGRSEITWAIADDLDRRAGKSGSRADSLLARAMRADAILARGDTAEAAARLTAVLSEGMEGDELQWNEALPRGTERLALARILLARREYRRAIEVADVFDAAWPSIYLLYLPASLQLRGQAAAALGDMGLASLYRNRLAQLGRSRVVALK